MVNVDVGRCEFNTCVQDDCERKTSQGAVYEFRCVCDMENEWKWYIGKNKKSISKLDELVNSKVNGQEEVKVISDEVISNEYCDNNMEGN